MAHKKTLLARFRDNWLAEVKMLQPGGKVSAASELDDDYSFHLSDLSLDTLDGIDAVSCENYLNVSSSSDSFLYMPLSQPEPVSQDLSSNDLMLSDDSQPILSCDTPTFESLLPIIEQGSPPNGDANACGEPTHSRTSMDRLRTVGNWSSVTLNGEVHAYWDGARIISCAQPLHVDQGRYFLRSKNTSGTTASSVVSPATSLDQGSRRKLKAKPVLSNAVNTTKATTLSPVIDIYEQHLSPLSDAHAFAEPTFSRVPARKRSAKGKSSRGRGPKKTLVFCGPYSSCSCV